MWGVTVAAATPSPTGLRGVLGPGSKISQRFHTMGYRSPRKSFQLNHSHQRVWIHLESSDISHLGHRTPKTKQNKTKTVQKPPTLITDLEQIHKLHGNQMAKTTPTWDINLILFLTDHLLVIGITPLHRNHQMCDITLSDRGFMAWNTHPKELRCLIPFRQLIFSNN